MPPLTVAAGRQVTTPEHQSVDCQYAATARPERLEGK